MASSYAGTLPLSDQSIPSRGRDLAPLHTAGLVENYHVELDEVESLPQPPKQPLIPPHVGKGRLTQEESFVAAICSLLVEHQIGKLLKYACVKELQLTKCPGLAINLLLLLSLTHACFPRSRRHTRKFFELSYYNVSTQRYGVGWDDMLLVSFWIIVFTGLRVAIMDYLLVPLAQRVGISKKKEKVRFAEQAWILLYPSLFWSLGMVCNSLWPTNRGTNLLNSSSCTTLTTGSILNSCGLAGQTEKWMVSRSGITLYSLRSGSNKFSLSTSKNIARITRKCLLTML